MTPELPHDTIRTLTAPDMQQPDWFEQITMMTNPRTCPQCGNALAADAHRDRIYCTTACRDRAKYARNPHHRRTHARDRYRQRAGIPTDAPLTRHGRPRKDGTQ